MPSGKVHALATVITAGVAAPVQIFLADVPILPASLVTAGCMLGLFMSPDLDVRSGSYSFTMMKRTGGNLLGWLWRLFWAPYARLIPRHRHPLSHFPILGTALRLVYLLGILSVVYYLVQQFSVLLLPLALPPLAFPTQWPYFWHAAAGLALVDTLHTLMDWTF